MKFSISASLYLYISGLLICLIAGCNSRSTVDQVLVPTHADFEDLFVLEDTIQFDHSVLFGTRWTLDVNSVGELLVLDHQSRGVYLFSPDGAFIQKMAITDCNPEAAFNFFSHASFLSDSHIAVLNNKGLIVFNRGGECVQAITDRDFATNTRGICSHRDTIFAMPGDVWDSTAIRAYSPDLTLMDQFSLPLPEFPQRASVMMTNEGAAMACFDDDVWWVYSESFDASPRLSPTKLPRYMPNFFVERTQDFPDFKLVDQSNFRRITEMISEAEAQATSVQGVYVLNNETRMIVYGGAESDLGTGAVIASHRDHFPAVSTWLSEGPKAIGNERLYIVDDPEDQPIGEAVNPLIIRYRFVPPSDG